MELTLLGDQGRPGAVTPWRPVFDDRFASGAPPNAADQFPLALQPACQICGTFLGFQSIK